MLLTESEKIAGRIVKYGTPSRRRLVDAVVSALVDPT
jgi:hypothetical protein